MDKTGKIGIGLAIITLVVWQVFYSKEMEKTQLAREQAAQGAPAAAVQPAANGAAASPPAAPGSPASPQIQNPSITVASGGAPKVVETLQAGDVEWVFTSAGGGVQRVKLLKHLAEAGNPVVLNEFGGVPIGATTEGFEAAVLESYETQVAPDRKSVTFRRTDPRQVVEEKRFTILEPQAGSDRSTEFQLGLELKFINRSANPVTIPALAVRTGAAAALHLKDQALYTGFNRSNSGSAKFTDVHWFEGGGFLGFGKTPRPVYSDSGAIQWAGVTNQYYSTIITPLGDSASEALARRFQVPSADWAEGGRLAEGAVLPFAVDGAVRLPVSVLEPGKELVRKFNVFAGPREYMRLKELGAGQEQIMDFGMFGLVSRALLSSMNALKGVLGSYAAAIIVLTIIIKGLMWPLQNKSTAAMKRMQDLQPKMTALREKYADDPQRLNQEMMGLYKKHGVNPMAGCLPMFVQIPIFFGFYNMLGKAVELRNSQFLWVSDLSQPDTVAVISGFPINILPLMMAGTMLFQMRLTPKTGDPMQQRMFMFMPLIFVVFCYNYASALALYWTVQNVFTILQLLVTNRQKTAAVQTVSGGGKR